MIKYCCCTGHRPKGFTFEYGKNIVKHNAYINALEDRIRLAVENYGITHFISGMALGVDLDFAETVLKLSLPLECAVPCPNQTFKWSEKDISRYRQILKSADTVTLVSERYFYDCMQKRNRYMVDKSELVIAVFNGEQRGGTFYTINYAKNENKPIELIDLTKF